MGKVSDTTSRRQPHILTTMPRLTHLTTDADRMLYRRAVTGTLILSFCFASLDKRFSGSVHIILILYLSGTLFYLTSNLGFVIQYQWRIKGWSAWFLIIFLLFSVSIIWGVLITFVLYSTLITEDSTRLRQ